MIHFLPPELEASSTPPRPGPVPTSCPGIYIPTGCSQTPSYAPISLGWATRCSDVSRVPALTRDATPGSPSKSLNFSRPPVRLAAGTSTESPPPASCRARSHGNHRRRTGFSKERRQAPTSAGKLPDPERSAAESPTRGPEAGAEPAGSCSFLRRRSSESTSSRVSATQCPLVSTGRFPQPGDPRYSPQSCRGTASASSAVCRFRFRGLRRALNALYFCPQFRSAARCSRRKPFPCRGGPRCACAGFQAPSASLTLSPETGTFIAHGPELRVPPAPCLDVLHPHQVVRSTTPPWAKPPRLPGQLHKPFNWFPLFSCKGRLLNTRV